MKPTKRAATRNGKRSGKPKEITAENLKRIIDETPDVIRNLKPTELSENLDALRRGIRADMKAVNLLIARCTLGGTLCKDESDKARARECLGLCDEFLMEILDHVSCEAVARAKVSDYAGLVGVASVCCGLRNLPELLGRMPESEWDDPASSDCAGFSLLEDLTDVIRFVESDAVEHPERYRLWAREQPFFPMMVFKHKAGYRRRFKKICSDVELGARCPIHVGEKANYSLEKPVNALVFDTLLEFVRVFGFLSWGNKTPAKEPTTPEKILTEHAGIPAAQVPIFLEAFARLKSKRLTKTTAWEWEKFVLRYLEAEFPDWRKMPALSKYVKVGGGLAKAREKISLALEGLAWPDSPEKSLPSRCPS